MLPNQITPSTLTNVYKNCAFVDFRSAEAFQAAVAASPFTVSGERLYVVQRFTKNQNQQGYGPRGNFQGNNRGRGGVNQGPQRGNFNSRGGFRGEFRGPARGGAPSTRGRGAGSSQAT